MTTQADFGAAVVTHARRYLGVPYVYGGTNPATGLDCSGLTQLVYRECGVTLPRVTGAQQYSGVAVQTLAAAEPGDLVFFDAPIAGHVGIYSGGGHIIHAPHTGTVVKEVPIWTAPSFIRRVLVGKDGKPGASLGDVVHGASSNSGGDVLANAGSAAIKSAGGVLTGVDAIGGFFGALGQHGTWVRVLQVVGGAGLVIGGSVVIGHSVIGDVATSVIPAGKVAKAAGVI